MKLLILEIEDRANFQMKAGEQRRGYVIIAGERSDLLESLSL